jgi:hypothetical protein
MPQPWPSKPNIENNPTIYRWIRSGDSVLWVVDSRGTLETVHENLHDKLPEVQGAIAIALYLVSESRYSTPKGPQGKPAHWQIWG